MKKILFFLVLNFSMFGQEQFSVFFQSNKHELAVAEMKQLEKWITQNKSSKILTISGYTDEDGTNQYNDTLAKKRVETVFNLLKNQVKIREDFKKISFGEMHQQSQIKSENRKVVVYYLQEKDLHKEAIILGKQITDTPKKQVVYYPKSIIIGNPDGSESEILLDVAFMQTLNGAQPGEKLKLENLNFVLNTFAITKESRGKLYELLVVMQQNPNLKIDIQGHVCCVKSDKQDLSTQRARAVYKFLEMKNIAKARMSYRGFGSTQPIFSVPEQTEAERAQNRRVEIEIVSN
ncbi:OmpA family protein [Flavobacterium sp.]|uniref:OmpA family protein n=1 Tax=Flavobacterium sp. TaxID=239 RepID=UPI003D13DA1E